MDLFLFLQVLLCKLVRKSPQNAEKIARSRGGENSVESGRLIFIHLQCWEVLPFLTIQRQRCRFYAVFSAPEIGRFSPRFGEIPLLTYTVKPGEKGINPLEKIPKIQWRRRPEIADFCPLSYMLLPTKWRHTVSKVLRWKWEVYHITFEQYWGQGLMCLS